MTGPPRFPKIAGELGERQYDGDDQNANDQEQPRAQKTRAPDDRRRQAEDAAADDGVQGKDCNAQKADCANKMALAAAAVVRCQSEVPGVCRRVCLDAMCGEGSAFLLFGQYGLVGVREE